MKGDFMHRTGFPGYALSNSNARIRQIRTRIQDLEKRQKDQDREEVHGEVIYREDLSDNRVHLVFPGKPSREVIDLLKKSGFNWSPSRGAWVRQLTANGKHAAREVLAKLKDA